MIFCPIEHRARPPAFSLPVPLPSYMSVRPDKRQVKELVRMPTREECLPSPCHKRWHRRRSRHHHAWMMDMWKVGEKGCGGGS